MAQAQVAQLLPPAIPVAFSDPWGSDSEIEDQPVQQHQAPCQAARQPRQQQQRLAAHVLSQLPSCRRQVAASTSAPHTSHHTPHISPLRKSSQQREQQHCIPSLQQLCLGVLGMHICELAQQIQHHALYVGQLYWLPSEMKAALLAVARRRGVVTAAVLSALADADWKQLDLAGCNWLNGSELLSVAHRMPNIQVLDLTGVEQLSAAGWRKLAEAWPGLVILRLGGSPTASKAACKALPHFLPGFMEHTSPVSQVQHGNSCGDRNNLNWECHCVQEPQRHAVQLSSVKQACLQNNSHNMQRLESAISTESRSSRLQQLRVLVWPDVPDEAMQLLQQQCPRVLVNPAMVPDPFTGLLPPAEVDPAVPLDEPLLQLVHCSYLAGTHSKRETITTSSGSLLSSSSEIFTFQQQYSRPGRRRRACAFKQRMSAAKSEGIQTSEDADDEQHQVHSKEELRSSHVLRTLDAWLDEI